MAPVATVFWNGTAGAVQTETHDELLSIEWHKWAHDTIGTRTSKGRAIQNVINIPKEENIKAYIKVVNLKDQEYLENNFIIMCTKKGTIKKTSLEAYSRPRANGINAININ
jgi:DNA gyrase/topoisomerase IV subunit A